ncbi:MAG: peptidoglycan recognition family protein [Lachnospiraceae bacterium]|nr:peptidoglycan recognition family protein [Lachnospiraceae bacterium]
MRVEESGLHRITKPDRSGWGIDGRSSLESRGDRGDSRSRQKTAYGGRGTVNAPISSRKRRRKKRGGGGCSTFLIGLLAMILAFTAGLGTGWYRWGRSRSSSVELASIQPPDWITQKLIRKNVYSRPAVSLRQVNDIVIHYVANPGSTAEQNRNYFDGLADQSGPGATSASAHFVIGLDGEIIQCIPISEIAYASNNRNSDSIAIECCHPDETGKFTEATYESLVKLTAWLCDETGISRKRVIRHYDITGKACPKYFVDHEDAWKEFLKAVKEYKDQ